MIETAMALKLVSWEARCEGKRARFGEFNKTLWHEAPRRSLAGNEASTGQLPNAGIVRVAPFQLKTAEVEIVGD